MPEYADTNYNISLIGEAISNAWTYFEAAKRVHADGRIKETDFRLDATISNSRTRLSQIDRNRVEQSFMHLARSLHRSRNLDGVDTCKVADLTESNNRLLDALPEKLPSASLDHIAIALENTALFLSAIDLPRCQKDALAAMADAATFLDTAVLADRHARWQGLASPIACQTGHNIRKVSNDLWRNHIMESTDPRMKIDYEAMIAEPLYAVRANTFLDKSTDLLSRNMPKFQELNHTNFGSSAIIADLKELSSLINGLRDDGDRLSNAERAKAQGAIMRRLSIAAERSALNIADVGSANDINLFFAISSTAATRSYLYNRKVRENDARDASTPKLN